jgi:protein TonB
MASSPATDLHPSGLPLEGILLAEELLDLAERAQAYTNAAGVAIALRRGQELLVRTSTGAAPEVGSTIPMSDGFITDCLKSRRPLCCRDTESDSRVGPLFRAMRTRSLIAIPICEHRDAKGVMMVIAPLPNAFQPTHTAILMTLSDIIASKLAARNAIPEMDVEIANVPAPAPAVSAAPIVQPVVAAAPVAKPAPVVSAEPVVEPEVTAAPVAMPAPPVAAEPVVQPVVAAAPVAKPAPVETAAAAPASVTPAPKPTTPASPFFGTKPLATEPATTPAPAAAVPAALLRTAALPLPKEEIEAKPDPGLLSPSEDPTRFKPVASIASSPTASSRRELAAINLKPVAPTTTSAAHPAVFNDEMPTIAAWEAPKAQTSKRPMLLGVGAVAAAFLVAAGLWVLRSTSKEVPPPTVSVPAPVATALPPAVAAAAPVPVAVKAEAHPKPAVAQPEQPKTSQPAESVAVEPKHQTATPVIEIAAAQPKQGPEPEMAAPQLALGASNDAALSSISKLPVALPARPKSELVPATLISRTAPVYPTIARQIGVFGAVLMNVTISPEGRVTAVRVISGPTQLRQAAVSAVQQWRYKPAMLNGQPAESNAEVQINFMR